MPSRWPARLAIRGPNITLPDGSPMRLRGFNLLFQLDSPFERPRDDTDGLLKRLLPGVNVVRLVMLHWDDSPTENSGHGRDNDCSEVQHGADGHTIRLPCLEEFDEILRWTAKQGLWAIITARASIAAGEDKVENPHGRGDTFFNDAVLRARFIKTWTTVAARYKTFDMIAGYELLSEPRVQPSQVPPERVRAFYEELVTAVQAVDARTPCFVGPAPFYSRSNLEDVIMPNKHNIIYNFNFFVPRQFVQDLDHSLRYPGSMPCCDLHDKEHRRCCPNVRPGIDLSRHPCCAAPIRIDADALENALLEPLRTSQTHGVPVLLDQWGAQRGVAGRIDYLRDMLRLVERHQMHWTYWQWRHKSDRPFALVYTDECGHQACEPHVDLAAVTEFAHVLASGSTAASDELRAYQNAKCYAQRYPDLAKVYCRHGIDACQWGGLTKHWHDRGEREGRTFACDDGPLCWSFCSENAKPWAIKCATFVRCKDCDECKQPALPPPPPPTFPPSPSLPASPPPSASPSPRPPPPPPPPPMPVPVDHRTAQPSWEPTVQTAPLARFSPPPRSPYLRTWMPPAVWRPPPPRPSPPIETEESASWNGDHDGGASMLDIFMGAAEERAVASPAEGSRGDIWHASGTDAMTLLLATAAAAGTLVLVIYCAIAAIRRRRQMSNRSRRSNMARASRMSARWAPTNRARSSNHASSERRKPSASRAPRYERVASDIDADTAMDLD